MTDKVSTQVTAESEEPTGWQASLWSDAWRVLRHDAIFVIAAGIVLLFVTMAAFPRLFTGADPRSCDLSRSLAGPSSEHWFGFDLLGCDYYARVVYGARASITIGITVTIAALAIAVLLGSLAGYYGGVLDAVIARFTDIVFGVPFILGAIVILTVSRPAVCPRCRSCSPSWGGPR
jgi:oligopeptide transport system permease protein